MSEHNTVGFPLSIDSFGLIATVQSFVYKAWFRRREYTETILGAASRHSFISKMRRWLQFHKDNGDIVDFELLYDESVWPADEEGLYGNRLILRVQATRASMGYYMFEVTLLRPLLEHVSSANPTSDHFSVPYNIFDVTFEVDHEGTPEHVKEALR